MIAEHIVISGHIVISELGEPGVDAGLFADGLNRCFFAAYLLTGRRALAERAVIDAIDLWDPNKEDENQLFRCAMRLAAKQQSETSTVELQGDFEDIVIPIELRRVLQLSHRIRSCFVLRVLAGLPSQVCAQLLDLTAQQINRYCRRAMMALKHLEITPL